MLIIDIIFVVKVRVCGFLFIFNTEGQTQGRTHAITKKHPWTKSIFLKA